MPSPNHPIEAARPKIIAPVGGRGQAAEVLRLVLFCLFAAILAAAIYAYIAIGHCYPALGVAVVAGAATALINPLAGRQRTPRMAGIIILVGGFWVSHQFAGVPDKGPHRLAYDAEYLAVYLIAILLARWVTRVLRTR